MPCISVKGGYKIRRSKGGLYPKVYSSLKSCRKRVGQMEKYSKMKPQKGKKKSKKRNKR